MEPRPDVIVDFVFEDGMLFVAVQNIGAQPAQQVHVTFEPPFRGLGGTASIPELPFRNIEFLRLTPIHTADSAAYFAVEPEQITATISYRDRSGENLLHDPPRSPSIATSPVPKPERNSSAGFFVISTGTSTVWISDGATVPLPVSVSRSAGSPSMHRVP
jgi:hypothetical protein